MTKEIQLNQLSEVDDNIASIYDAFAPRYDQAAIEEMDEEYVANIQRSHGTELFQNWDHTGTLRDFGVSKGWKRAHSQRVAFTCRKRSLGCSVRFEREQSATRKKQGRKAKIEPESPIMVTNSEFYDWQKNRGNSA
ncbi:hypothetical protein BT96DRAFT_1013828 [Gymnopus androsaceus JB14]|uniref:Uncharacterized protein n=1 Tax=Gymnopus androsaceus JB14 TaxID=1447944 RepID=A0A6A4I7E3_9AGAR|nr:hypothetical protein BT96DRAFT_1013828 [Gymnopus androsaceus JB14]